jgi:hypothetical protein
VIVDGQCYIVILPGVELPNEVPSSLEYYSFRDDEWVSKHGNKVLTIYDTYRYPVTEAEYRSHHWCIAHGVSVPDGYEVVGFGKPKWGEYYFTSYASRNVTQKFNEITLGYRGPILRKKACEHKDNVESYEYNRIVGQRCLSCGMVRTLGDWEQCQ